FADGKLKTIELSGGDARFVADAPNPCFASWNREGTLLFVPDWTKSKGCTKSRPQAAPPSPSLNRTNFTLARNFCPMESISSITLAEPILPPWTQKKIDSCSREKNGLLAMARGICSTFSTTH